MEVDKAAEMINELLGNIIPPSYLISITLLPVGGQVKIEGGLTKFGRETLDQQIKDDLAAMGELGMKAVVQVMKDYDNAKVAAAGQEGGQ